MDGVAEFGGVDFAVLAFVRAGVDGRCALACGLVSLAVNEGFVL